MDFVPRSLTIGLGIVVVLLLTFVQIESANAQGLKIPSLVPFKKNHTPVEPIPLTDQSKANGLFKFPKFNLMPQQQPGQMTMLERVQMNSNNFFRNTGQSVSQFFENANQSFRRSTEQTRDFFSQAIPPWATWQAKPENDFPMVRPPDRSAFELKRKPKVRF